jgi:hypothetical protein
MFEFRVQDFLNGMLQLTNAGISAPSLQSGVTIKGSTAQETAIAAVRFLSGVFSFLNTLNETEYDYTNYFRFTGGNEPGADTIIMIESGILDSPVLRRIIEDCLIYNAEPVNG